MPYRKIPLVTGEYYHIFNRGVARMPIFLVQRDYQRFLQTLLYYRFRDVPHKFSLSTSLELEISDHNPLAVEIISYCFMPNHFHLLIKQNIDNGISHFMKNIGISYSKYFNIKHERVGPLLQGQFKAVHIETTEQLLHVSRYIHLNPFVAYLVKDIQDYVWSSYPEYVGRAATNFCQKESILNNFPNRNQYKIFVRNQEDYAKELAHMKHLYIDYES